MKAVILAEGLGTRITTHSRTLVDAFTDEPASIVVCSREDGESRFERLDAERLSAWLEQYSLGELWSMGELGGWQRGSHEAGWPWR